MNDEFIDKELGRILIVRNVRAKSVIARCKSDFIQLTVPSRFSMKQIVEVFTKMKPRLVSLPKKPAITFHPQLKFQTFSFYLNLDIRKVQNYYMSLKEGILYIVCPEDTDFNDSKAQDIIKNYVEKAMRYEANRLFPQKLEALAKRYNFTYTDLKINKSRSRWGSCSSKKGINLSYFCTLLPEYLIDFVMLHELCHTIEMNHGERFWKLLDSVTDGKAKQLTLELNKSHVHW
uniref:M48 family metallopeptidase n=1 Tax=uncultured Dysgonomonas sp. TaxID=206096 RepID=UPI00262DBA14|nr:YgjP-like metallopeptidase domain-containing protein [uncultured Dysgonomonas sp.]